MNKNAQDGHQELFESILIDCWRDFFGKNPEPYDPSLSDEIKQKLPPLSSTPTGHDVAVTAFMGALAGIEKNYQGRAATHVENGISQAKLSEFFRSLAERYDRGIRAGGGQPNARDTLIINNFKRAAAYADASRESIARGASYAEKASQAAKAGGVIGAVASAFSMAMGAASGGGRWLGGSRNRSFSRYCS